MDGRVNYVTQKRIDFRLPPKHGGYRPVAGNPSGGRKVTDLPKPPAGEGGGSKKPFTKDSLKRYKALCGIIDTIPAYPPMVIIPGRTRLPSGRKSDLVYVEVLNHHTMRSRLFYFDQIPTREELIQVVHLLEEIVNG